MTGHGNMFAPDVRDVPVFIYGMTDPDGTIRYVGRSAAPERRFRAHRYLGAKPEVRTWLETLSFLGKQAQLVVLHTVPPGEDATPHEARLIAEHARSGKLLNGTCSEFPRRCRYCREPDHGGDRCLMNSRYRRRLETS